MPSDEPRWLPPVEVIRTNQLIVAQTGEPYILLNEGKLSSACARPQNMSAYQGEDDIVRLATALIHGIAHAHAFIQGNKRTPWSAA